MEVTPENLQIMAGYLQQTLSPDLETRRAAEKSLESVEVNRNYPVLLLHLMDKAEAEPSVRVSSAITFKNYVKRNWRQDEGFGDKIHAEDREAIKQYIVGLMLNSPEQVQKQLSDAISIIGREDFPKKWPGLLTEMVEKINTGDFNVVNGVLHTAHSIFKRYRHEFKSQELWEEIKIVLDSFAAPLTELFKGMMELAKTNATDPKSLKIIFSSILLICKIFYSLNFQDLPEFFEDNMKVWMGNFLQLLQADNKLLQTSDEEEAGLLEQVKSQVCDNVALYAQKYDEEFSVHLQDFVTAIWGLLVTTGQEVKYDLLVSNAIQFLASVAERPGYKSLFDSTETLTNICEKVVVPNIQLRDEDVELFEDNPEEYMRRDIEGSDVDTRRRAACDLVQALSKSFEGMVIQNFSRYVAALLEEYGKNPAQNWKSKDAAIFLVTSLAAKGQTQKKGVTQTSELVNITEFYQTHILADIKSTTVPSPIIKADVLKYLMVFRNQLPAQVIQSAIPDLMVSLKAEAVVVHTYAAHTIERLFMVRHNGVAAISREMVQPIAAELMTNLFSAMEHPGSTENEYIMKAVMRTMSLLQEQVQPMVPQLLTSLKAKLALVSKNPSKPHFNHYLFECLCVAIKVSCKANPSSVELFEDALFEPFTGILQADVQEFIPYVFQILSMLMEQHTGAVPETYMTMFPFLLTPLLWERQGNIPPLVRLLQSFIAKGAGQIEPEKLNGLLGVVQKLIASKTHDHEGFYLLNYIIEFMPRGVIQQYLKQVFILLFQRLSNSKTTKYIKSLLVFFCLYAIKFTASSLIETVDGIQPKMFGMVVEKLFLQDLQKVSGQTSKRICAYGVVNILTEAPAMVQGDYAALWPRLLQALIGLFELPEDESVPDDEHFIEIEDTPGYQAAYSQLAFAGKPEHDPLKGYTDDPKISLAKHLGKMSTAYPGMIQPLISTGLESQAQGFLQQYCQTANVHIN